MQIETKKSKSIKLTFLRVVFLMLAFLLFFMFIRLTVFTQTALVRVGETNESVADEVAADENTVVNTAVGNAVGNTAADVVSEKIIYAVTSEGESATVVVTNTISGVEVYRAQTFNESEIHAAITANSGGADYSLSYAEPSVFVDERNKITAAPYNLENNQFSFRATYQYFMNSDDVIYKWYYRNADGEFSYFGDSFNTAELTFGKAYAVGSYVIKCEVTLSFNFRGDRYNSTGFAEEVCLITAGEIGEDNLPSVSGVYGKSIDELNFSSSSLGVWTYSTTNDQFDTTRVLSAGIYFLKYDLAPKNTGFAPLKDVVLRVVISPFPIKIVVEDKVSVEGNPLEKLTYRLSKTAALQNGDTEDMLQITLSKHGGTTHGSYNISGSSPNKNYDITFVSEGHEDGNFSVGGTYTILPNPLEVVPIVSKPVDVLLWVSVSLSVALALAAVGLIIFLVAKAKRDK